MMVQMSMKAGIEKIGQKVNDTIIKNCNNFTQERQWCKNELTHEGRLKELSSMFIKEKRDGLGKS